MQRYYFMISFLPKEANFALLMGRCISILHGYTCQHHIQGMGVSFPAWSDASIGDRIVFVHTDKQVLSVLRQQAYFMDMQAYGFFNVSQVEIVPRVCEEVRFKRNQGVAKLFSGEARRRLKRLEKRARARGEPFKPDFHERKRDVECFHRVPMASDSSQQDFTIHIQKEQVGKPVEPSFGAYGLATNEKFKGSVPDFSFLM
ncbi:type I-F CRISPR-associated endoribonuclease Cas6/Csy4 [uncultured Shewanella sp.]|uniref:type I-F CRISPR-associated endoribonuclease Cas6/Csy4 n=1 Tax=uncultured Shewanella sp. TaxID=173975 RepID=UPI002602AA07|nr:type I-F CRISPR-associated endoribonuclease Cas6/Csy4 [uncultured Shewanella sp.]